MSIERWTGLEERASEMLFLDPRTIQGRDTPAKQSVAGLKYPLPVSQRVSICRSIEVLSEARLLSSLVTLATSDELRSWYITLISPDSTVLHKDVPILLFYRVNALLRGPENFPRYFGPRNLFDSRQSYMICTEDGLEGVVPFRFIYGAP